MVNRQKIEVKKIIKNLTKDCIISISPRPTKPKNRTRKTRRRKHNLDWLDQTAIIPYLGMEQSEAAHKLSISISTLKRHFYKLGMGRWPLNRTKHSMCNENKYQIRFLLNERHVPIKKIDKGTIDILRNVMLGGNKYF